MIYKAFLNRQEITGFPVKGKETSEIWGGNTLLWKKEFGMQGEIERYNVFNVAMLVRHTSSVFMYVVLQIMSIAE